MDPDLLAYLGVDMLQEEPDQCTVVQEAPDEQLISQDEDFEVVQEEPSQTTSAPEEPVQHLPETEPQIDTVEVTVSVADENGNIEIKCEVFSQELHGIILPV